MTISFRSETLAIWLGDTPGAMDSVQMTICICQGGRSIMTNKVMLGSL